MRKKTGNGARKALDRYFAADPRPTNLSRSDHLLAWLWQEGFVVNPHELPDDGMSGRQEAMR